MYILSFLYLTGGRPNVFYTTPELLLYLFHDLPLFIHKPDPPACHAPHLLPPGVHIRPVAGPAAPQLSRDGALDGCVGEAAEERGRGRRERYARVLAPQVRQVPVRVAFEVVALAGWELPFLHTTQDEMCRPLSSAARVVEALVRKAAEPEANRPRERMVAKS